MNETEFVYGYYFTAESCVDKITSLASLDAQRPHWLHFDYTQASTEQWFNQHSGLNPLVVTALMNDETQPRATALDDGVLISLRGVNLAANSDPEDMVSIRLWCTKDKVISTRRRTLLSTGDIANDLDSGCGPHTPSALIVRLTEYLITRMSNTIYEIEDKVAEIEENIVVSSHYALRNELSDLRRQIISLRRYLSPQREAMTQLIGDRISFFSIEEKIQLRETTDHLTRFIEDLDSVKDRAIVCQEELNNSLSEQMNNRMFILSIVAAIFLPLGFLTGLLGVNVGGIPGADNSYAFIIFMILLILVVAAQVWLFRKKKWF